MKKIFSLIFTLSLTLLSPLLSLEAEDAKEAIQRKEKSELDEAAELKKEKSSEDSNLIQSLMQNINEIKTALKDQLKELDSKLNEASKIAAEAKKIGVDILTKDAIPAAQAILDTIQENFNTIKEKHTYIATEFSKAFNDNMAKVRKLMSETEQALSAPPVKEQEFEEKEEEEVVKKETTDNDKEKSEAPQLSFQDRLKTYAGYAYDITVKVTRFIISSAHDLTGWLLKKTEQEPTDQ